MNNKTAWSYHRWNDNDKGKRNHRPREMSNVTTECNPFDGYYKINKLLFTIVGQWPLENGKRGIGWRIFIPVHLINVALFMVCSFISLRIP